jgi:hypothetical protein
MADQHSIYSTLRERVVEHVFVGDVLRSLWRQGVFNVEVLRSEFDAHGYDLVMARGRVVRHIQFKTGTARKPSEVSVARTLAEKPSGYVIWIRVTGDLEMGPFFWFGGKPGRALPPIDAYANPLRATHNKKGERPVRQNHRLVPGAMFEQLAHLDDVLTRLFGDLKEDLTDPYAVKGYAPAKLSGDQIKRCVKIIECGDAVDPASAARELPLGERVAIATIGAEIVGVGAIKRPRPKYAHDIAIDSGFAFSPDMPELGYVAVECDHRGRGLSHRLVAELLSKHAGPLFATTSSDSMKASLKRAGFAPKGHTWESKRTKAILSLWIRDQTS